MHCQWQKQPKTGIKSAVFGCATINSIMAIEIRLNGEVQTLPDSLSVGQFLDFLGLPKERVAVERNRAIVPKAAWETVVLVQGDELEVVHFVGGGSGPAADNLVIAGKTFRSRLLVGTGTYPSHQAMREAHERSGTPQRPPYRRADQ